MSKAKPIPDGYHSVTPYLCIGAPGASQALTFYAKAFGASELYRMPMPDGRVAHAEIQIGNSRIMLSDEMPEMGVRGPGSLGTPVGMCIYTEDCDGMFNRAVEHGAKVDRPLANQFYGDRSGTVVDPFGHKWTIATHIEDVSPEEMQARMANMPNM